MRKLQIVSVLCTAFALAGCVNIAFGAKVTGSGVEITENRDLTGFDKVKLQGSPDVTVTVGEPHSVTVTADDNLMEIIETEVDGTTLVISTRDSYSSKIGVKVAVTTPELHAVSVTGSGDLQVLGAVETVSFDASVTGSGDLLVKALAADEVEAAVTGSGDLKVQGVAKRFAAAVKGSGDIDATDLKSVEASASIMGSGDIRLNASESLSAQIYGSGDVVYTGNPKSVNRSVMGSGDVRSR